MAKSSRVLWVILGVLALLMIGVFVLSIVLISWMMGEMPMAEEASFLEVHLSGPLPEGPTDEPLAQLLMALEPGRSRTLWDLRRALELARDDPKILGARVEITGSVGWAAADEILGLLDEFRESGKPVHTLLSWEFAGDQQYYLATAGDVVWLSPVGGLMANGLRFEVEFWRGTLEKIHVEPHFIMYREYKSAGEPYSRTDMSDYFRESLTALGEDIQTRMVERVVDRRNLSTEEVFQALNRGLLTASEARELGWVDRLGFVDEVNDALAEAAGQGSYSGISWSRYIRGRTPSNDGPVALIFGQGEIYATGSPNPFSDRVIIGSRMARLIQSAVDDDEVEAIVFRVDSPGGSAVGSDKIWRVIEKAQAAGKPVVASFSNVAGSGGYWVAMGADRIVAQPNSITGSIGVVFGKMDVRGLYEWAGANVSDVTLARNADIFSLVEPLKPEHEERIRAWMDQTYSTFKVRVGEGRGLDEDRVEEIARGRIWSGTDAQDIGLVDATGGLDTALTLARELAGLPADAGVRIFPRPKTFFEALSESELSFPVKLGARPLVSFNGPVPSLNTEMLEEIARPRPWAIMPPIKSD